MLELVIHTVTPSKGLQDIIIIRGFGGMEDGIDTDAKVENIYK